MYFTLKRLSVCLSVCLSSIAAQAGIFRTPKYSEIQGKDVACSGTAFPGYSHLIVKDYTGNCTKGGIYPKPTGHTISNGGLITYSAPNWSLTLKVKTGPYDNYESGASSLCEFDEALKAASYRGGVADDASKTYITDNNTRFYVNINNTHGVVLRKCMKNISSNYIQSYSFDFTGLSPIANIAEQSGILTITCKVKVTAEVAEGTYYTGSEVNGCNTSITAELLTLTSTDLLKPPQ